jgi:hypothetical protein
MIASERARETLLATVRNAFRRCCSHVHAGRLHFSDRALLDGAQRRGYSENAADPAAATVVQLMHRKRHPAELACAINTESDAQRFALWTIRFNSDFRCGSD